MTVRIQGPETRPSPSTGPPHRNAPSHTARGTRPSTINTGLPLILDPVGTCRWACTPKATELWRPWVRGRAIPSPKTAAQIWEGRGPHTSGPRPCGGLWMARRRCGEAAATHPPTCLCACATAPGPFIPPDACGKAHVPWVCPAEMHGPCVPRNGSVLGSPKDTAPQNTSGPTPHGPQRPFVFKATSQWTTELSSQVLVPHFSHGPNTFKGHVQRQQYDVYLQRDMSVHPTKGPLIAWAMNTDDCEHLCCGKNLFMTHATGLLDQQESA